MAWVNFANDVPNPNISAFDTIFRNTYAAGGRIVRWWFHTNGTVTPGYDSSGKAQKIPQSHIDGVKAILNAAHNAGVAINISLWSFDMLQSNAGNAHTNNQLLLENDANRQAYIDNYLTPLVRALKGTPGLYSYEIFNEPEGMGLTGWATYRTFYEVHYYTSNGLSNSAFQHPASYWKLDKKLVIGEFAAQATDGVAQNDLYTYLYSNGYSGGWAWSYDADWPWPAMRTPMQNLFNAHSDVGTCPR